MEKVLHFIAPSLSYIDSGKFFRKPFSWLYVTFAVISVLIPFAALFFAIDAGVFDAGAGAIFTFLLTWFVIVAASWVGMQIWWDRREKVLLTSAEGSEFPAIPVIAHFVQTLGEWAGTLTAIIGCGASLFMWILQGEAILLLGVPLFPVIGFLTIVLFRFMAECMRALAAIANNTKKQQGAAV
ncbi:MAG: hypothetical protein LBS12_06945 [Prevotellaceae bacterium]|jgi:hypothetical protein|nr:hypothetical protein [Prevotellaceae bacterium]